MFVKIFYFWGQMLLHFHAMFWSNLGATACLVLPTSGSATTSMRKPDSAFKIQPLPCPRRLGRS